MKIIGVDPGYDKFGIAVVEKRKDGEYLLFSDCLRTSSKISLEKRIFEIGKKLREITKEYGPKIFSIEKLFFTTNQKTAMGVAEVKGVATYIALEEGLETYEFTPLQIKTAIIGYGKAEKSQIAKMIPLLIKNWKEIKKNKIEDDEFDAIGVALTCSSVIKTLKNL